MTDNKKVINFMEHFNKKQNEDLDKSVVALASDYLTILLYKIKLITGGETDIKNKYVVQDAFDAFGVANDEFSENDGLLNKYGSDSDTPSIQLFAINAVINRAVEIFFGDEFQADKL